MPTYARAPRERTRVRQQSRTRASGTLVLHGYGLRISLERGHLVLEDGVADERRRLRLSRIDPRLTRLVVLGHSGLVSLEALRWLHDVGVPFVQIDRDGRLILAGGPTGPHLPALRRAQALAATNPVGIQVVRRLLEAKLAGQMRVLEELPAGPLALPRVRTLGRALARAQSAPQLRSLEAEAAALYWSAWQSTPIRFGQSDQKHIPAHWLTFGTRASVLTSSPRRAVSPGSALLNYGYSVLEAEARIAALVMGLDPAVGLLHADQRGRDSFACDVMEAVRPDVDAFVLELLKRRTFRRSDFFETRDGGCRLMPPLASMLAQTSDRWAGCLAPVVEQVASSLVAAGPGPSPVREMAIAGKPGAPPPRLEPSGIILPTPLTQRQRREGRLTVRQRREVATAVERPSLAGQPDLLEENTLSVAAVLPGLAPLSRATFMQAVQPALRRVAMDRLAQETGLSRSYCARIRGGSCVPHRRHWKAFQRIVESELRGPKSID